MSDDWELFAIGIGVGIASLCALLFIFEKCVHPVVRTVCRSCCGEALKPYADCCIAWQECCVDWATCQCWCCCATPGEPPPKDCCLAWSDCCGEWVTCQCWCCFKPSRRKRARLKRAEEKGFMAPDMPHSSSLEIVVKDEGCIAGCMAVCCPCCMEQEAEVDKTLGDVTMEELEQQFVDSGVIEDISIMVAVDFTRSNVFKGRKTFGGKNLHSIDPSVTKESDLTKQKHGAVNPYEKAILAAEYFLRTDRNFPLYFFGSAEAAQMGGCVHVRDCTDYLDLWRTYREHVESQSLSGPGRFTPVLEKAMERTRKLNRFHVLLYLTDGDVEDFHEFGDSLARASQELPLVVVVVGVGDGPFDQISHFDDYMPPGKKFDNLQFTAFEDVVATKITGHSQKMEFYAHAFNEVPRQYQDCKEILGYRAPMRRVGQFKEDYSLEAISISGNANATELSKKRPESREPSAAQLAVQRAIEKKRAMDEQNNRSGVAAPSRQATRSQVGPSRQATRSRREDPEDEAGAGGGGEDGYGGGGADMNASLRARTAAMRNQPLPASFAHEEQDEDDKRPEPRKIEVMPSQRINRDPENENYHFRGGSNGSASRDPVDDERRNVFGSDVLVKVPAKDAGVPKPAPKADKPKDEKEKKVKKSSSKKTITKKKTTKK